MAKEPRVPKPRARKALKPPAPPKQDDVEKFELKQEEINASLAEGVEEYAADGGLRDVDDTSKIALASQRLLDQKADDKVVYKRNETSHDVTYPEYGAKGDGVTDDEPAVTLAIAALSAGDELFFPRGTHKLSDDVTVPAGNACVFESGAEISIDTTKTFAINGTLDAGSHQIFAGAGTIDISGMELGANITEIDPVWFGNSIVTTFTDQDATPSVNRGRLFKTANTVATTITNFNDGIAGQMIRVVCNDAFTTIDFSGSNLKGNGAVDWTPAAGDNMICTFDGTDWFCTVTNDPNAGDASGGILKWDGTIPYPDTQPTDLPLLKILAERFPNGITILSCGYDLSEAVAYSVTYKIFDAPIDVSPTTIETVAGSSTEEEDDGTLEEDSVAAGQIVFATIPLTDVDWVYLWFTFTVD